MHKIEIYVTEENLAKARLIAAAMNVNNKFDNVRYSVDAILSNSTYGLSEILDSRLELWRYEISQVYAMNERAI